MVTKDALMARAKEGRIKAFTVAGMDLYARRFSLAERIECGDRGRAGDPVSPHEYLAMALCNEDGSPYWTLDEAKEFADADGLLAEAIVNAALDHAGMTKAAQELIAKN